MLFLVGTNETIPILQVHVSLVVVSRHLLGQISIVRLVEWSLLCAYACSEPCIQSRAISSILYRSNVSLCNRAARGGVRYADWVWQSAIEQQMTAVCSGYTRGMIEYCVVLGMCPA